MPERVAIVAAMKREIHPLVHRWERVQVDGLRGWRHGNVLVVCGGIGAGPAQRAAEMVVAAFRPDLLISAGFAGSKFAFTRSATSKVSGGGIVSRSCAYVSAGSRSETIMCGPGSVSSVVLATALRRWSASGSMFGRRFTRR